MNITDEIFIDKDTYGFTLKKRTGKFDNKDKEISNALGYFGTFQAALKKYIQLEIINTNLKDVKEALTLLKELDDKIDKIGEEIGR